MSNRVVYSFVANDKYSAIARKVAAATDSVGKAMARASKHAAAVSAKITKVGRSMQTTSLVASAASVASLKSFGDLEAGVNRVLNRLDEADVGKFRGQIQGLIVAAREDGFAFDDASAALANHVQIMGVGESSFAAFRESQRLAVAASLDLAVANEGVSKVVRAYGADVTDASRVSAAFFRGQIAGKVPIEDLMASVGKMAPVAASAGVGFEELIATTAALTARGLSTTQATRSVRGAIKALLSPSREAAAALRALGVPVGAAEIKAAGLSETLAKLAAKAPGFIKAFPELRAFDAAALADVERIMQKINDDVAKGTGITAAHAREQSSFNDAMGDAIGQASTLAAKIGEGLAPVVRFLADGLRFANAAMEAIGPGGQRVVAILLGITAVAAPVLLFFGQLGTVAAAVGTALAFAFGSPIVLVGLLVAGVSILLLNLDKVSAWFSANEGSLLDKFGGALDFSDWLVEKFSKSEVDVGITVNDPGGAVQSVKTQSSGASTLSAMRRGPAMAGAL
jgi:TP901 family phage tail tape measure protein